MSLKSISRGIVLCRLQLFFSFLLVLIIIVENKNSIVGTVKAADEKNSFVDFQNTIGDQGNCNLNYSIGEEISHPNWYAVSVEGNLLLVLLSISLMIQSFLFVRFLKKADFKMEMKPQLIQGDMRNDTGNSILINTKKSSEVDARAEAVKREKKVQNDKLFNKVIRIMEEDEVYRDSNLTVEKVARQLKINSRHLSGLIHAHKRLNFNTFVNEFRIKKAKQMIAKPDFDNYTLEAIGKEVGFNSKTSYIHAFKKFTGVTPSQFKKELTSSKNSETNEFLNNILV